MNNVEIEYLPKMGEAETIKTVRQGRKGSLATNIKGHTYADLTTKKSIRKPRTENDPIVKVLCHRIIKFDKASESQKNVAKAYLSKTSYDNYSEFVKHKRFVTTINRTLFKKFKEYRQI
jgi:hypothetical protein